MAQSNISVLTKSHNIIAAKKRARKDQVKEVVFDEVARRSVLLNEPVYHIVVLSLCLAGTSLLDSIRGM